MIRAKQGIPLLLTILATTTLLTGCWDRTETNDLSFVVTSSADLEDDGKYRIAHMLPLPGSMGGASGGGGGTSGGKSYYIDSEVGITYRDAFSKLQTRMSRRLFLSHRRTIVIGEKLAQQGIHSLFDVLPRSTENRMTTFLVVTKGKGYDLLNTTPKFERFPSEVIRELAKSRYAMPTSIKDIGISLSFNSDPIMNYFEPKETQATKEPSKEIQLIGYVQFKGDRMVGIYKKKEAQGLMWLRNQVKAQQYTFPMKEDRNISVAVIGGKTAIVPTLLDDKVMFNVTVEARGAIREDLTDEDLFKSENLHNVETKFAEQVKSSILATIKQMKKEGTDSAQLGLIVWRTHPQKWNEQFAKDWEHYFKEADFNIVVNASIPETGVISKNVTKGGI